MYFLYKIINQNSTLVARDDQIAVIPQWLINSLHNILQCSLHYIDYVYIS